MRKGYFYIVVWGFGRVGGVVEYRGVVDGKIVYIIVFFVIDKWVWSLIFRALFFRVFFYEDFFIKLKVLKDYFFVWIVLKR